MDKTYKDIEGNIYDLCSHCKAEYKKIQFKQCFNCLMKKKHEQSTKPCKAG